MSEWEREELFKRINNMDIEEQKVVANALRIGVMFDEIAKRITSMSRKIKNISKVLEDE